MLRMANPDCIHIINQKGMKSKTAIIYLILIVLLGTLTIVSGYYAKGDWLKGQLGQVFPAITNGGSAQNGSAPAVAKPKIKRVSTEKTAVVASTANPATPPCQPDANAAAPAIYCLRASLSKWDPSGGEINFIYTLEGSEEADELNATIYDQSDEIFFKFPARGNVKDGSDCVDMWNGLNDAGAKIQPGQYYYAVSGNEDGRIIPVSKTDFEVI